MHCISRKLRGPVLCRGEVIQVIISTPLPLPDTKLIYFVERSDRLGSYSNQSCSMLSLLRRGPDTDP